VCQDYCTVRLSSPGFSCFLICYFVAVGALHSFPTRRSSDLAGVAGGGSGGALCCGASAPVEAAALGAARRPLKAPPACSRIPDRDRKSTRLNSSHLGISYAVFCLKKKKSYN